MSFLHFGSKAKSQTINLALFALAIGGFGIGTGEFVIMGLLPDAAADLQVSIPQAGHLISAYALGVVIGAPLLAILGARLPQRQLLVWLMVFFALGNLLSSIAPTYTSMLAARFFTGLPHGTYFGVASLVAASLVPREKRTRAVALVLMGLTVATLIGVPIAAMVGQWLGWRSAFVIVGLMGVLAFIMVAIYVPFIPANDHASPLLELSALKNKQVWLTLAIGAIGFGGLFAVFSYVKPTMMTLAGVKESTVPWILALFGVGMVAGNLIGARLADIHLEKTIRGILIWGIIVLAAFYWTSEYAVLGSINILLIGTLVALGPALQSRLMDVAGKAQTLAAALNHSAFNAANALGAWLGGASISVGLGWQSTAYVGALLAVGGFAVHHYVLKRSTL